MAAKITLYFFDRIAEKPKRKRFMGDVVAYEVADEVLGDDFVTIRVDDESLTIKKEDVIYVYIKKDD